MKSNWTANHSFVSPPFPLSSTSGRIFPKVRQLSCWFSRSLLIHAWQVSNGDQRVAVTNPVTNSLLADSLRVAVKGPENSSCNILLVYVVPNEMALYTDIRLIIMPDHETLNGAIMAGASWWCPIFSTPCFLVAQVISVSAYSWPECLRKQGALQSRVNEQNRHLRCLLLFGNVFVLQSLHLKAKTIDEGATAQWVGTASDTGSWCSVIP